MDTSNEEKFLEYVFKETKLTNLKWQEINIERYISPYGRILGKIYETELKGKKLLIYRFTNYVNLNRSNIVDKIKLEITDLNYNSEYEIYDNNFLPLIYDSIRYKNSDIESYLNSFAV